MEPGTPLTQIPWLCISETLLENKKTHYSISHHCSYQAHFFMVQIFNCSYQMARGTQVRKGWSLPTGNMNSFNRQQMNEPKEGTLYSQDTLQKDRLWYLEIWVSRSVFIEQFIFLSIQQSTPLKILNTKNKQYRCENTVLVCHERYINVSWGIPKHHLGQVISEISLYFKVPTNII